MTKKTDKKLAVKLLTLNKLTGTELDAVNGGITGVSGGVSNPTSGDTNGVKLSAQWYLQKYTLRCGN